MKIKAKAPFTAFDEGRMKVFNIGDKGDVTDAMAQDYIDAGKAEAVKDKDLPQLDHDGDGEPGGSVPDEPPSLTGKNKKQLLEIAAAEGVEANEEMTNKAITEAILAKREDGEPEEGEPAEAPPAA